MIPLVALVFGQSLKVEGIEAPQAKKVPYVRDLHGEKFVDPYFWMRNRKDPDLLPYLKANNAYADKVMRSTDPLQGRLYREMVGRMQETDLSVPTFDRGYFYYSRTIKGQQYPLLCRRKGSMQAQEQVLLDQNRLAKGKNYFEVGAYEVSPDGNLLAYSVDVTGGLEYELYVKDLRSGRSLPDRFGRAVEVVWMSDSRTLLFTRENAQRRNCELRVQVLGGRSTRLAYENDAKYDFGLTESKDHRFAFLVSHSKETTEAWSIRLDQRQPEPLSIAGRREGIEYYPEHRTGSFYIRTNDGAPEFRIVKTPVDAPGPKHWSTVIPERPGATIEDISVFRDFAAVKIRQKALSGIHILDFKSGSIRPIAFPDSYYTADLGSTPDFNAEALRLSYVSLVTPRTTYDYTIRTRKMALLKRQVVKGYDPSRYASELLWLPARDGVSVPVSLVYRKGVKKPAPMLVEAYGAYGLPNDPYFASGTVSLLDRGVIVGTILARGGGELGEAWHDAGKMAKKLTTFTDVIDCAKLLASKGYTTPQKLILTGGSAGGLTMGAIANIAPYVCRAMLVYVPFVDVVNTMMDESIPLTTQEFMEWGNPKIQEQYGWMRGYSPYDNVGEQDYPAMLVRSSLNDSQVPYWEPVKWVTKLRDLRTDADPLLLKMDLTSGHGGSSGRYDALLERAYDFAFVLAMLGVNK